MWGGGAGAYLPTRVWNCIVEKSVGRELAPKHPHDASLALELLLEHLVADVRNVRAGDEVWMRQWVQHMSACVYETRVCRGRGCTAAGVLPTCRRLEGSLPLVTVHAPRDDLAPTHLATLLARLAAPERRGLNPMCDGVTCERCPATGVRCPCPWKECGGKVPAHGLQPCETRKGIWPPPTTLFVRISRSHANGVKWNSRVTVPAGTFAVHDLFAVPPDTPQARWRAATVHYRAVAAGYHQGTRSTTGHYWALVRGTEPHAAGPAVNKHVNGRWWWSVMVGGGYRLCNDSECAAGPGIDPDRRWEGEAASRRVAIVVLERVDGGQ
eukprot:gene47672-14585_t